MSTKKKQAVVWYRFKFADTPAGRMQIQRAADKLFRLVCVTERGQYTEEDVVRMVATALEQANGLHLGSPHAPQADTQRVTGSPHAPRADEADPLAGEEFEEP